ncbi:MAG: hypothetical protein KGQ54_04830, partial [Verrucomicrobia bacterium]|nr:hypothetical protein [Verrucomicrobiota bacterium]
LDIAIQKRSIESLLAASSSLLLLGKDTSLLIEDLAEHFRNHLLALQGCLDPKTYHLSIEESDRYKVLSKQYTQSSLLEMVELIYPFFHQPTRPFLSQQQFESLLLLLMKKGMNPGITTLIERLEGLEMRLQSPLSKNAETLNLLLDEVPSSSVDTPNLNLALEHLSLAQDPLSLTNLEQKHLPLSSLPSVTEEQKAQSVKSLSSLDDVVNLSIPDELIPSSTSRPLEEVVETLRSIKSEDLPNLTSATILPTSVRHQNLIQFAIVEWNATIQ